MLIIHHHLLPSPPRHSHTSSISSFLVGKLGRDKANPGATEHKTKTRSAWRGRDRETERKRWCSWTCSSTTAADDGCTRRTTPSSEFEARKTTSRERERESGALLGVTLCGAPPRREKTKRETERGSSTEGPTYHCLLNVLTSSFFLCVSQRG